MRDELIEHLRTYNQGRVEGEFADILEDVEALERQLHEAEAEGHAKRASAIKDFIEKNGNEIEFQKGRAMETADRVLRAIRLKAKLDSDRHAHEEVAASQALATVMHDLNETARVHGMIVRLLSGDQSAETEIDKLHDKETTL